MKTKTIVKIFLLIFLFLLISLLSTEIFIYISTAKTGQLKQNYNFRISSAENSKILKLKIDDREDFPDRPEGIGWCGEASIQMAAIYYGAFIPQTIINKTGDPEHLDLYFDEIPEVLKYLNLDYQAWYNNPSFTGIIFTLFQSIWRGKGYNVNNFIKWIKNNTKNGIPVLIGVKIYPDKHPEWPLNHFMLAIGYTKECLLYNPTAKGTEYKLISDLSKKSNGYSFFNKFNFYYGYAIYDFKFNDFSLPVYLKIISEENNYANVVVKIYNLEIGKNYTLKTFTTSDIDGKLQLEKMNIKNNYRFKATQSGMFFSDKIDKRIITVYRCY